MSATAVACAGAPQNRLLTVALTSGVISLVVSHRRGGRSQERRAVLWAMHAPDGLMDGQLTESAISAQLAVIAAGDVALLEGASNHLLCTDQDAWRRSLSRERLDAAAQLASITVGRASLRAADAASIAGVGILSYVTLAQGHAISVIMSLAVAGFADVLTRRDESRLILRLLCEKAATPVPGMPVTIPEAEIIEVLAAVAGWRSRILRRASLVVSMSVSPQGLRAQRRLATAAQRVGG